MKPSSSSLSASSAPSGPDDPPSAASGELDNSTAALCQPVSWVFAVVGLTLPFLPIYFAGIGLSDSKIALLLAVPPLVIFFGGQAIGHLTDIHFNQRTVLVVLSAAGAAVSLAFPFVKSFEGLMGMMALQALTLNPRISILNSLVLSSRGGGERRYGLIRSCGSAVFVVAGAAAGFIADRAGGRGVLWIFPMAAAANALCAATGLLLRDRPHGAGRRALGRKQSAFWAVQGRILADPIVRAFLAFLFLSQIVHGASVSFQSRLITDPSHVGGGNLDAAMALGIGAIAEIVVFLFFHRIAARVRLMPLLLIAALSQTVRWGLVFLWPTLPVIHATNVLNMATFGLMHIGAVVLINRETPPELRASGQTLLALVYSVMSATAGQLLAAAYFNVGNVHTWYGVAALLSVLCVPFWIRTRRMYESRHRVSGFWVRD